MGQTVDEAVGDNLCSKSSGADRYDLALVMPVYNEADCIAAVVRAWRAVLLDAGVHFVMIIVDDGSDDETADILQRFAGDDRIEVIRQANRGHGPAVLRGYRQAIARAPWIFQCDSDDEMSPESFPRLWALRHRSDAVFGCRLHRRQPLGRRFITGCARLTVRLLFGRGIRDVNAPYRLLRTTVLQPILEQIAPDTFAPNVIISGLLTLAGARLHHVPVRHQQRRTGEVTIAKWNLWRSAWCSFLETVRCRRRFDPARRQLPRHAGVSSAKRTRPPDDLTIRAVPSRHTPRDELQGSRSLS